MMIYLLFNLSYEVLFFLAAAFVIITASLGYRLYQKNNTIKALLKKLKKYETRLEHAKTTANSILIGLTYFDADLNIKFVNKTMATILNIKVEDMIFKNIREVMGDKFVEKNMQDFETIKKGKTFSVEKNYLIKGKEYTYYRTYIPHINMENNQIHGFFMISENITEKIKAKALEKERLQLLIENESLKLKESKEQLSIKSMELIEAEIQLSESERSITEIENELTKVLNNDPKIDKVAFNKLTLQIKQHKQSIMNKDKLLSHINSINPKFFQTIQQQTDLELTNNEMKHCAYIKLQLSNKEVANIMHVTSKSVEMARYRLKKKLKLGADQSLHHFINSIQN